MRQPRRSESILAFVAGLAIVLSGCASGGSRGSQSDGARGPALDVASLLSGNYRLQDGDSNVRLDVSGTSGVGSRFSLLATASGTYRGRGVNEQAILRLETEGPDVRMSVIPRFGEPVSVLSPDVNEPSEAETRAACDIYLKSDERGWAGATQGQGDCIRAVGGAIGQWQVEILPGTIRFTDPATKQALVFQKSGGAAGR
jgi:hypothetical protein